MKKLYYLFGLSFLWIILDQLSKYFITIKMDLYQSINIIAPYIKITYIYNKGAAWGILNNQLYIISLIGILILRYIIKYLYKIKEQLTIPLIIAFSFLLGGLVGNLIDRLFLGYVIDFIDILIFNYNYPVFNLADCFIVIGTILIIIIFIRSDTNERYSKRRN